MNKKFVCKNLDETYVLARNFAQNVKDEGAFVCLYGEVGAGKTAFTKAVCDNLDIKEKVTSPSFVILNEYKTGVIPVYHFDLYRLENEGISTIINELEEYSEGRILTFVEWAEFSQDNLPFDRIEIKIERIDETGRNFIFSASGEKSEKILSELKINEIAYF